MFAFLWCVRNLIFVIIIIILECRFNYLCSDAPADVTG